MLRDTCFSCKKQGHWAKDCPDKQLNKPMSSSSSPPAINCHAIPEKQCPGCGETCLVITSHTEKNPGRNFYKCPDQL
ncbi:Dna topoisomerase, partial [Thalictrum thalictroides]